MNPSESNLETAAQQAVARNLDDAQASAHRDPLLIAIVAGTLALYLVSMPKTVALEDDSIFILSGYFNGVSHPPGYPLYTLVVHLFTQLPFGDVAARAHASSALFAALSCGLLFLILRAFGLARQLAALATLAFAVSGTFWSQSIITEVYSLNLCLNLGLLWTATRIAAIGDPPTKAGFRDYLAFSALLGLALANHWPLTVLALPGYLLLIARSYLRLPRARAALVPLPAIGVAAGFYLYLYLNNHSQPFVNFSGRFDGWREFVDFVMRAHYAAVDQSDTAGWLDKLRFAGDVLLQFARELNLLLVFAAFGLYRMLGSARLRPAALALGWVAFANSFLLVMLIGFDYGELYSLVFRVYPVVSIAALFVLAGLGLRSMLDEAGERFQPGQAAIIVSLCVVFNLVFSLPQNFRHGYTWGEEYAATILDGIPRDAVVFADGDVELGLLAHARHIEGRRPDLELYSSSGLLLDNRLFDYRHANKRAFLEAYMAARPEREFYIVNNYYGLEVDSGTPFGARAGRPDGEPRRSIDSAQVDLLVAWSNPPYSRDPWTRIAVAALRHEAIAIMTPLLKTTPDIDLKRYLLGAIDSLLASDDDLLVFLVEYIRGENQVEPGYFRQQLDAIDRGSLGSKQMQAHYAYVATLAADANVTPDRIGAARGSACRAWPSASNEYCRETDGF